MGSASHRARTDLLRPVLEVALGVARSGEGRDAAPRTLAPVLRMQRLGPRAWSVVDRAGDDDAFRARVAEAVGPEELDEAGRLWLTRPEGWAEALEALVEEQASTTEAADAARQLRRAQRARQKAEKERDGLRAELDRLEAARAALDAEAAEARERAAAAEERAEQAVAERVEAVRQLGEERRRHQRTHEELRRLRDELDRRESRAPAAPEPAAPGPAGAPTASRPAAASEPSEPPASSVPGDPAGSTAPDEPALDREAASAAVASASAAAAALAGALDELSGLLGPTSTPPVTARPRPARPSRPRRRAPALPGGIHDDSPDAAEHLVRLPGCVLLVDGYNATLSTWADEDLPAQRQRLVTALDRLDARVGGLDTTVVFDGTEDTWRGRSTSRRVHVRFTDADTEADDVILAMIDQVDPERPVVVASDDARVRAGARRRGARPIGIVQLQAVMG